MLIISFAKLKSDTLKKHISCIRLSYTRLVQTDMLVPEINFNFLFDNVKLTSWKETEYNLHFLVGQDSTFPTSFWVSIL